MKFFKGALLFAVASLVLVSCNSNSSTKVAENDNKSEWEFSAFGLNVDTENDGYSGSFSEGEVEVYSKNKSGKLIPTSTDGLAFYYTKIDPLHFGITHIWQLLLKLSIIGMAEKSQILEIKLQ